MPEPITPEDKWPGRNYEWQDPGTVDTTGASESATHPLLTSGEQHHDGSEINHRRCPEQHG